MIRIGFDIATTTGWSVMTDDVLTDYGVITIDSKLNIQQRLNFLSLSVARLLDKFNPDRVVVEDVICGISGIKTLVYLARLNGVVMHTCFSSVKDNMACIKPTEWKKDSFLGINGSAKKWQIQLACLKHFNISYDQSSIGEMMTSTYQDIYDDKDSLAVMRTCMQKYKSQLNRKKIDFDVAAVKQSLKDISDESSILAKSIKDKVEKFEKSMNAISNDLVAQTGITTDIADSLGLLVYDIKNNT